MKENKIAVEVNPTTSKILQELAFENGWSWRSSNTNVHSLEYKVLYFDKKNKKISYGKIEFMDESTKLVSLEDAIDFITKENEDQFKIGDWVTIKESYYEDETNQPHTNLYLERITDIKDGMYCGVGRDYKGNWDTRKEYSDFDDLELASPELVESALIDEAKKRGFTKDLKKVKLLNTDDIKKVKGTNFTYSHLPDSKLRFGIWTIFTGTKWIAEPCSIEFILFGFPVEPGEDAESFKVGCKTFLKEDLDLLTDIMKRNGFTSIFNSSFSKESISLYELIDLQEYIGGTNDNEI